MSATVLEQTGIKYSFMLACSLRVPYIAPIYIPMLIICNVCPIYLAPEIYHTGTITDLGPCPPGPIMTW